MQAVGVIGAGQMGAGIAQVSAAAGYRVLLMLLQGRELLRSECLDLRILRILCGLFEQVDRVLVTGNGGVLNYHRALILSPHRS